MSDAAAARAPRPLGTYPERVARLRRSMTAEELAGVAAVRPRQVQHWAAGRHRPQGASRDRLLELDYVVELLNEVYDEEGVEIWLHARNRSLGARRPLDILIEGDFPAVLAAVERLTSGAM